MKKLVLTGIAGLVVSLAPTAVMAAGAGGGSPPPGGDPIEEPVDGGDVPGQGGTTPSGGGGTTPPTGGATPSQVLGSGSVVFNLDVLPTGASGTQAFYQPAQDNTALGLGTLPSAQGVLNQTVGGVTLGLRTDTFVSGTSTVQTRIQTENMSTNFGYLGAPAANQITVLATSFSTSPPGALYANFSSDISYFSVEAIRLVGTFTYDVTLQAFSGANGTGTALGSVTGTVGDPAFANFSSRLFELDGIAGARSVALVSTSNNTRYDNITINPAAVGDVPEPATWAMMLAGFGLVGGAIRRRPRPAARIA